MEQLSIVISIITLVLSVITWCMSEKKGKRINNINLESIFYTEIFKDYLIIELPRERMKIFINQDGFLKDYDGLCDCLLQIKKKAAYFQYRNHDFYWKLKSKLDFLEDTLIKTEGKVYKGRDVNSILEDIDSKLEDIYSYILKSYFG